MELENVVCTIVSANYLAYARTLAASLREVHPDYRLHVLIVDEPGEIEMITGPLKNEPYEVVWVRDLGIASFEQYAFKFDVLELNTNVKPTFLKSLLARGFKRAIYLDPDIFVYSSLAGLFDALKTTSIIITPHTLKPIEDDKSPSEQAFLRAGVFNLGFIGVSDSPQGREFLDWWEQRCLTFGYSEPNNGLFVDQKWTNFIPCFFEDFKVVRDPGVNTAYWNLHERSVSRSTNGIYFVNGDWKLVFYHFSGIDPKEASQLSKYQNRFSLSERGDLQPLFAQYRQALDRNGHDQTRSVGYAFSRYSNGEKIAPLARAMYAAYAHQFCHSDPFDANGEFYRWMKSKHLQQGDRPVPKYTAATLNRNDSRVRIVNRMMRLAHRALGTERYTALLRYLGYVAVLRNQKEIFPY